MPSGRCCGPIRGHSPPDIDNGCPEEAEEEAVSKVRGVRDGQAIAMKPCRPAIRACAESEPEQPDPGRADGAVLPRRLGRERQQLARLHDMST